GVQDLAGNQLATPSTFQLTTPTCPCQMWSDTTMPADPDHGDAQPVELGAHFRVHVDGYITAIRYYKAASSAGPHTGHLWSGTGSLLASVSFLGEGASGWQTAQLSSAVYVQPGTDYVVSYFAPTGNYAASTGYFA